ncbi:autotransporter adhesin BpaC-like [Clytia hemisphaerica]|uniref:Uncharacterized protein n=1 Tax=Clytia hemisphaerica TaxID=252671 RepID=A0A7M5X1U3_9CNID
MVKKILHLIVLLLVIVDQRWCIEEDFESEFDNTHQRFTVDVPIILYGKSYTEFHVHSHGLVILGENFDGEITSHLFDSISLISPYYYSNYNLRKVKVEISSQESEGITKDVKTHFSKYQSFNALQVVTVQWESYAFFDDGTPDITVILEIASDPQRSFSRITYKKDANDFDYESFRDLIEFNEKLIGFSAGDGKRFYKKDSELYLGEDFYTDVLIGQGVRTTPSSGVCLYLIGEKKDSGNNEVMLPDRQVDPDTNKLQDIDECQREDICHPQANCINLSPGYQCECKTGYIGDGKTCVNKLDGIILEGTVSGNVNGISFPSNAKRTVIAKVDLIIGTIKPLDEKLKNIFSTLTSLHGAVSWLFADSASPNMTNGYAETKGYLESTTTIIFNNDGEYRLDIHETFKGFVDGKVSMETRIDGKLPSIGVMIGAATISEPVDYAEGKVEMSYATSMKNGNTTIVDLQVERVINFKAGESSNDVGPKNLLIDVKTNSYSEESSFNTANTASLSHRIETTTTTTTTTTPTTDTSNTTTVSTIAANNTSENSTSETTTAPEDTTNSNTTVSTTSTTMTNTNQTISTTVQTETTNGTKESSTNATETSTTEDPKTFGNSTTEVSLTTQTTNTSNITTTNEIMTTATTITTQQQTNETETSTTQAMTTATPVVTASTNNSVSLGSGNFSMTTSATNQTTYATNQTTSKANQTTSATNQTTSASNQTTSASNQTTSAANQTTPATNQTTPATNQTTVATNQTTSATNQTTSATNQTTSVTNHTTSATNQTTSAANQTTSTDETKSTQNITTTVATLQTNGTLPLNETSTESGNVSTATTTLTTSSTNGRTQSTMSTISDSSTTSSLTSTLSTRTEDLTTTMRPASTSQSLTTGTDFSTTKSSDASTTTSTFSESSTTDGVNTETSTMTSGGSTTVTTASNTISSTTAMMANRTENTTAPGNLVSRMPTTEGSTSQQPSEGDSTTTTESNAIISTTSDPLGGLKPAGGGTTTTESPRVSSNAIEVTSTGFETTGQPPTLIPKLEVDYQPDETFYNNPKPKKYLLVAQSGTIKRIDLEGRLSSLTYAFKSKQLNYLVDVEYDCLMENIYFTDVVDGYIGKISTNSPSHQVLFQGLAFPEGIAVDWIGRRIYWTESKSRQISVGFLDGSKSVVLFKDDIYQPRDILCDPNEGKIYWTDWNYFYPKIEVADMSGRNRRVLLDYRDVNQPNGLTLDYKRNRLCWTDYKFLHVACMKLDGPKKVEIISKTVLHPFSVTNSDSILYWTDWQSDKIQRQSIETNKRLPAIKPGLLRDGRMYGVRYVEGCPDKRDNKVWLL